MRILFATTELAPFVKTGGLADVSAALPCALEAAGCQVALVAPALPGLTSRIGSTRSLMRLQVLRCTVEILRGCIDGTAVYLVACDALFNRAGGPYADATGLDHGDNALRFAVFCRAIEALVVHGGRVGCRVDVLHLNDWPTGLAAGWVAGLPHRPAIVFSVHNLAYQGLFPGEQAQRLGLPATWWTPEIVEFHGRLSFMKAGLVFADHITTVSPTYAAEIQSPEQGAGLDGLMRHLNGKLSGILNGIDMHQWNPRTDPHLDTPYDATWLQGKWRNKQALRARLGLNGRVDVPLVGFIGRLVDQKGVDLIVDAVAELIGLPAQLVVLGVGDPHREHALHAAAARFPGQVAVVTRNDEALAHQIEAAADLFLMPSRFEPCGLNQMYSMRYGTIPVVRRTGGLADTVRQVWGPHVGDGTGFLFDDPTPQALISTLRIALALWRDVDVRQRIQRNGMGADFSWDRSARAYLRVYQTLQAARAA